MYLLERYVLEDIKNKKDDEKYSKHFEKIPGGGAGFGGDLSDSYYYFVSDKLDISPDYVAGLMKRLERSGLILPTGINANAEWQEYAHTILYSEIKTRLIFAMESSYGNGEKLTSDDI